MEENFRRIVDAVRLPEGSRARIRAQIASRAEEQEASMQNKPKKHLDRKSTRLNSSHRCTSRMPSSA